MGIAEEIAKLRMIMNQNSDKNFVQRILNPYIYPVLPSDEEGENYKTHKMAWGETNNGAMVYPEVVQNPQTGILQHLDPSVAGRYAIQNREFIPFSNPEEADWFTRNYKKVWGPQFQGPSIIEDILGW